MRLITALVIAALAPVNQGQTALDRGFDDLYNLRFDDAHQVFRGWEQAHPADPLGPVFDAAAYLFSEFERLDVLRSEFLTDDAAFKHRKLRGDPSVESKFEADLATANRLSAAVLKSKPNDEDALFATVLAAGLHADYLSLIEHQDMAALSEIKRASETAAQLLAAHPDCYDAYIASGTENYLLSLKPAPVRWLLQVTGASADRQTGIDQLRKTAEHGHYLQPYAELLLAIADLRAGKRKQAENLLSDLAVRFPQNALYRQELAKLSP